MTGSLSIFFVLLIVILLFVATLPEPRAQARPAEGEERKARRLRRAPKGPIVRVDVLQRLRTDRSDLQTSVGREFSAPELGERIWPPIR